ncbi:MAG: hypothetical protein ACTSWC_07405 [Promethearchaeota archaeon]
MLRQVILYYQKETIFTHIFAKAYSKTKLEEILTKKIVGYIDKPSIGQVFSKPIFDFQTHFGMFGEVFFLYITDMSDRPKVISKEIQRSARMFQKLFPNPVDIKTPSVQKDEFVKFINETHYYLHPKITLMGPHDKDRQKIIDLLKINPEPDKRMMDFAVYHQIQIGNLFLDLWNFIIKDNLSPLWNNYIRGSDMILFVINGSDPELNEKELKYFNSIRLREGKYSKAALFLTHANYPSFIGEEVFKEKYPFLEKYSVYKMDLDASDGENQLRLVMTKALGLKQPLPPEFKNKLKQANEFVSSQKFQKAMDLLKELIQICENYQEYNYIDVFQNKISELQQKLEEKKLQEEIERSKIKAPKKISFGKFHGAKRLPTTPQGKIIPDLSKLKKIAGKSTNNEITTLASTEEHESILQDIDSNNPFFNGLSKPSSSAGKQTLAKKTTAPKKHTTNQAKTDKPFFTGIPDVNLDELQTTKSPLGESESIPTNQTTVQSNTDSSQTARDGNLENELETLLRDHKKIQDVSTDLDFFEEIQADHERNKQQWQSQSDDVQNGSTQTQSQEQGIKNAIHEVKPGMSIDSFKIRSHVVEPIDLTVSKTHENHENVPSSKNPFISNTNLKKKGFTRRKTLTFERSPLVQQDRKHKSANIQKTKSSSKKDDRNPLQKFTIETSPLNPHKILTPAEKLEQLILIKGETLDLELCEKFISQLRMKLKRNVTDADIEKVADLYVKQKRQKSRT